MHRRSVWLCAAAVLAGACGGSDSLPPFSTQTVGPGGGTFALENGFTLIVPAGAVDEPTPLSLRVLTEPEKAALTNNGGLIPKRFLGGFYAEPDGFVFNEPIQVVVPLEQLADPGSIPVQVSADSRNRSYIAQTRLTYDPTERTSTITLDHFSFNAIAALERALAHCENPDPAMCDCTTPETVCRCGTVHVESGMGDFSSGACQVVSEIIIVTFPDCPGGPSDETTQSDETAGCDEEDDTGPPPGPPAEYWHGVLTLELDYTAPVLDPDDITANFFGIKTFHDTAVYDFELEWPDTSDWFATAIVDETHTTSFEPFDNEVVPCGENHGSDTAPSIHLDTTISSAVSVTVLPVHRTVELGVDSSTRTLQFLEALVNYDTSMPELPGYLGGFYITVDVARHYDDDTGEGHVVFDSTLPDSGFLDPDDPSTYYTNVNPALVLWDIAPFEIMIDICETVPSACFGYELSGDHLASVPLEAGTWTGSGSVAFTDADTGTIAYSYSMTLE